jgi:hypothetical protein
MCDEILAEDAPQPDTFAELSAAALCVLLGAVSGRKLERTTTSTADWRMNWPPGVSVDVEVTTARRKKEHVRRQEAANRLLSQFTARSRTDDLVIHMPDPTNADDVRQVIEAGNSVEPNQSIDVEGRWSVRRLPVSRETFVISANDAAMCPARALAARRTTAAKATNTKKALRVERHVHASGSTMRLFCRLRPAAILQG